MTHPTRYRRLHIHFQDREAGEQAACPCLNFLTEQGKRREPCQVRLPTSSDSHQEFGVKNGSASWNLRLGCQRNNPSQGYVRKGLRKRRMPESDPSEAGEPLAKLRTWGNALSMGQQTGAGFGVQPAQKSVCEHLRMNRHPPVSSILGKKARK